jgi:hypothetical protein
MATKTRKSASASETIARRGRVARGFHKDLRTFGMVHSLMRESSHISSETDDPNARRQFSFPSSKCSVIS